jgi:hypothetical protein
MPGLIFLITVSGATTADSQLWGDIFSIAFTSPSQRERLFSSNHVAAWQFKGGHKFRSWLIGATMFIAAAFIPAFKD